MQLVVSFMKEVEILKTEVQLLKTQLQRIDITLLTSEQLATFTEVRRNTFSLLLDWLRPVLPCNLRATSSTRTRYLKLVTKTAAGANAHTPESDRERFGCLI